MAAFSFLPQTFWDVVGTYEWYFTTLSFCECRLSGGGGDTQTLPAVIKFI